MRKIRVLMVLGNTGRGGSQAYVMNVLRNIDWNRFQVDIAACWNEEGGFHEEMIDLGCNIHIIPYFRVVNYFSYVSAWKKLLSEYKYDIIHAHATNSASIYLKVAKQFGCKTIAHSHSAGYRGTKIQQFVKKIFASGTKKYADYWYACSDKAAERLFGLDYHRYNHYYTIPNAIDAKSYLFNIQKRKKIREQIGVGDNVRLYGHIGSFSEPKNHKFLLNTFKEILNIDSSAKIMCCGEGYLFDEIKAYANVLGIANNVIFTGGITDVPGYMMAIDTMIFPSLFEGFPITVIEAEATGLPVIISDSVTREVEINDTIKYVPLSDGSKAWASCASSMPICDNREEYNEKICQTQYNMQTSINTVMRLYEELNSKI